LKKATRYLLLIIYIFSSFGTIYLLGFVFFKPNWVEILIDWSFLITAIFFIITIEEFYHWARIGRRSEMSDIIAIAFFFFLIFFFTKDLLTSLMGAFSIYLWVGLIELKEYPVLNKILIISLVTYNVIFIAGLVSFFLEDPFFINTAFAFSFWIILGLGFLLFGRKYIIVWRFMSPAYLILFLYVIAWLVVVFINQYTSINFIYYSPLSTKNLRLLDFIMNIYFILIVVNWIIYFIAGPILDKLLGIKRIEDGNKLLEIVDNVKKDIGIKGRVKVGFGKYPILNALAYGSIFDKRIAIIAENIDQIPQDELKGIVAHELAHLKGNHTLILTFIATADLIFRMLLGFPATYYDYTFGEPKIPMISFIFLNLVIYMILYIFVRILEGKADLNAKKAGYAKELAKALYNLESFYATGREIGLNTMLLCDEKISKENQILDYMDTAEYLYHSMIKPSRASLLANFMNSHPPSYFRIAAILGEELHPLKEALLPFICLKRSKQIKYAKKFDKARNAFKIIANKKFKEFFNVQDISLMLEKLGRKEIYKLDLNNDFIFKNKITNELIVGKLENIQFIDNVCNADQYIITNLKTNQKDYLDASLYTKTQIKLNETYFFKKKSPLLLKNINLNENKVDGNFVFLDKQNKILKTIRKTKLPNSIYIIENFKDHDLFLKLKGELKIFRCINVKRAENFEDYELHLDNLDNKDRLILKLKDLIIRPKNISLSISRNTDFRKSEIELIKWLVNNKVRVYIYLKKPVNNLEIGYIQKINFDLNNIKKNTNNEEISEKNFLIVENIFGKEKKLLYSSLEIITFEYNTAIIQKKSETSMSSKLGYKILKKVKPKSIFYVNKV
jgi:Zn-dependent protease with chaperone function